MMFFSKQLDTDEIIYQEGQDTLFKRINNVAILILHKFTPIFVGFNFFTIGLVQKAYYMVRTSAHYKLRKKKNHSNLLFNFLAMALLISISSAAIFGSLINFGRKESDQRTIFNSNRFTRISIALLKIIWFEAIPCGLL